MYEAPRTDSSAHTEYYETNQSSCNQRAGGRLDLPKVLLPYGSLKSPLSSQSMRISLGECFI